MTFPRSLASLVCLIWQDLPEGQTRRTPRTLPPHPPRTSQGPVWLLRLLVLPSQELLPCAHMTLDIVVEKAAPMQPLKP